MEEKKYNCKAEDVPVIAGFALKSLETDWDLFVAYSPVFTSQFVENVKAQQADCYSLIKSTDILNLQKVATKKISDKSNDLRLTLNPLEGYLKMAAKDLDILLGDSGLAKIRTAISKGYVETLLSEGRTLITVLKRNEAALVAKGMKPELLDALASQILEIEELNTHQNGKKNERSRVAKINIKVFNELWVSINVIFSAGRAIFRGVDEVKLKEYTMSHVLKRVHSLNSSSTKPTDTTTTDTTEAK